MFKWFDQFLDGISQRLAENLVSNTETVAYNKTARELSRLPDAILQQAGLSREKLSRGSESYPWHLSPLNTSIEDLEHRLVALTRTTPGPASRSVFSA